MQNTALVTGSAGFIPSHVVDTLLADGWQVIGVDNFKTGSRDNLQAALQNSNFTFIEADVATEPSSYLPTDIKLNQVYHMASPASPMYYQADPVNTYSVNAFGCHHLLTYLKQQHPQARFLFASTSEVYGDPQVHPQPESYWGNVNPNGVRSCYDEAKRMGETICGVFNRDFGIDTRIIRIFNTYGPRMDIKDGRIIPNFVSQGLQQQPYTLFGDGQQTRSYCYVADLVAGIRAFMATDLLAGETINLGRPEEYTVKQTAELIHKVLYGEDATPEFITQPLPGDDPTQRKPDITKAKQLLNWEPHIDFKTGLETTIADFRERMGS